MDFELTPEQRLARQTAREFAEGEIAPVIARFDETETFPAELIARPTVWSLKTPSAAGWRRLLHFHTPASVSTAKTLWMNLSSSVTKTVSRTGRPASATQHAP